MDKLETISDWLEQSGFDTIIVTDSKTPIALLFYSHLDTDTSKRIIYAIHLDDNLCCIGNVYYRGKKIEMGFFNAISITDISPEALLDNLSRLTEQIEIEEKIEYYDRLMYQSQKYKDVTAIIKQFAFSNNYNILEIKSK